MAWVYGSLPLKLPMKKSFGENFLAHKNHLQISRGLLGVLLSFTPSDENQMKAIKSHNEKFVMTTAHDMIIYHARHIRLRKKLLKRIPSISNYEGYIDVVNSFSI